MHVRCASLLLAKLRQSGRYGINAMLTKMDSKRKILPLMRHYVLQMNLTLSRLCELWSGIVLFVTWLPRLVSNSRALFTKTTNPNGVEPDISISLIPTVFINLEARTDRRHLIEEELCSMGFVNVERFQAISRKDGSLGCAESHIRVLESLLDRPEPLFMICEDDLTFSSDRGKLEALIEEFRSRPRLDVLCVAYRLRAPRLRISRTLAVANSVQTASCYILRRPAVATVLESFRESRAMLLAGEPKTIASIDVHWKKVQRNSLFFAIPNNRIARQRPSFSDIALKVKDYGD